MRYDEIVSEIKPLSVDQKIILVAAVWDQITESPERIPLPDFHVQTLQQRLDVPSPALRAWSDIRRDLGLR